MKTEKKQNEQNCIPGAVVKEETDGDSVKIKEEAGSGNQRMQLVMREMMVRERLAWNRGMVMVALTIRMVQQVRVR